MKTKYGDLDGETMERCRAYLKLLACSQVDSWHGQQIDASDLVQQTLLDAVSGTDQFRGKSEAEFLGWLRKILSNNLVDAFRYHGRAKRNIARNRALDEDISKSFRRVAAIADSRSTPSHRAATNEHCSDFPRHWKRFRRPSEQPSPCIYSLGVILFELLTGELPFRGDTQILLVQILTDEPPSPRKLNAKVPRDLETICLKCLEKEPHRRYETAQLLAEDCERFLKGIPVLTRPVSRWDRSWRWCRRNPLVAALSASIAALLVAIAIVASVGYVRTQAALIVVQSQADAIERDLYISEMNRAGAAAMDPDGLAQVGAFLGKWLAHDTRGDRRGWEWYYLDSLMHQDLAAWQGHEGGVFSMAWSPDGSRLASASGDQTVKIWGSEGQVIQTLIGHNTQVNSVEWNQDGSLLASASYDGTVKIWDAARGETLKTLPHAGPVDAASWSHDGQRLATASSQNLIEAKPASMVTIWNSATWEKEREFGPTRIRLRLLRWNPRRAQIAAGSMYGQAGIWDPETGEETDDFDGGFVAWKHDGTRLAVGDHGAISLWDVAQRERVATINTVNFGSCVAWSPSGSLLAYVAGHKVVKVCDVATKTEQLTLRGHLNRVTAVCWHPRGHRVATGSIDGAIKIWRITKGPEFTPGAGAISWDPRGSRYASRIGAAVVICDPRTSQVIRWLNGHTRDVLALSWSPDGASVASVSYDGEVRIWDAATGEPKCSVKTQLPDLGTRLPAILSWSPDSRRLAFAQTDLAIRVIDATTAETVTVMEGDTKKLRTLAWNPDGSRIVSGGEDEILRLWDPLTGQLEKTLGGPSMNPETVAVCWSPDGARIASAHANTDVNIWDTAAGRRLHQLHGHTTYVHTVAWSPDGQRIASADESGSIRIWDAANGQQTLTLSYPGGIPMVAWNPDGKRLACVGFGGDATVRIWDASIHRSESLYW